tara:strand:- start:653 stop:1246 length:594 start_codon:yes stop_codon:yes gene_type:complete
LKFSKEEKNLRIKDKSLKRIIDLNGHIEFKPSNKNQFDSLVEIVISQFISTKAANSIYEKIKKKFNTPYLNESHFQKLSVNEIKKLGLSTNKAKSIKELSNLYIKKEIKNLTNLNKETLDKKLQSVFGIGPWSVNMFEIFCVGRLNIFSSKDAGLRLAMNNLNMVKKGSDLIDYDNYAQRWDPYKSIACIHLWKTVD